MTFDLDAIVQSKADLRRKLAALPAAQKLAMLDDLRERLVAIHSDRRPPTAASGQTKVEPDEGSATSRQYEQTKAPAAGDGDC